MKLCLYGINSEFPHGARRTSVYMAESEEDAVRQWKLNPNHARYQRVTDVYAIKNNKCNLRLQYGMEISEREELDCEVTSSGELGDYGIREYKVKVRVLGKEGFDSGEVVFTPDFVHTNYKDTLELMVCLYGLRPNWVEE